MVGGKPPRSRCSCFTDFPCAGHCSPARATRAPSSFQPLTAPCWYLPLQRESWAMAVWAPTARKAGVGAGAPTS